MDLISLRGGIDDVRSGSSPTQMANPKVGAKLLPKVAVWGRVGARCGLPAGSRMRGIDPRSTNVYGA